MAFSEIPSRRNIYRTAFSLMPPVSGSGMDVALISGAGSRKGAAVECINEGRAPSARKQRGEEACPSSEAEAGADATREERPTAEAAR